MQVHDAAWSANGTTGAGNAGGGGRAPGGGFALGNRVALGASKTEEVGEWVGSGGVCLRVGGAVVGGIEPMGWPAAFEPAAPDIVMQGVQGGIAHVLVGQEIV